MPSGSVGRLCPEKRGAHAPRGDERSRAGAISRLLADPHLRQRMGAAGRKRVRQLFTWDRSVARLEELYGMAGEDVAPASPADAQHVA